MDYGPEFTATRLRNGFSRRAVKLLYIELGEPCENGYRENFNRTPRDELLSVKRFYGMKELLVILLQSLRRGHTERRHSIPGYRLPAVHRSLFHWKASIEAAGSLSAAGPELQAAQRSDPP